MFEYGIDLHRFDAWEPRQEFCNCRPALDILEQGLHRNARTLEQPSPADFAWNTLNRCALRPINHRLRVTKPGQKASDRISLTTSNRILRNGRNGPVQQRLTDQTETLLSAFWPIPVRENGRKCPNNEIEDAVRSLRCPAAIRHSRGESPGWFWGPSASMRRSSKLHRCQPV